MFFHPFCALEVALCRQFQSLDATYTYETDDTTRLEDADRVLLVALALGLGRLLDVHLSDEAVIEFHCVDPFRISTLSFGHIKD